MATMKPADVDAYLAAQPPAVRARLVEVRGALRRALPTSVEAIKYGMPAWLVDGRAVASLAGFKAHYAVYIVDPALFAVIADDLPGREASKGILRFALDEPVPEAVFARLSAGVPRDAAKKKKQPAQTKPTTKQPAQTKPTTKQPAQTKPTTKPPAQTKPTTKQPAQTKPTTKQPAKKTQTAKAAPTKKKAPAKKTKKKAAAQKTKKKAATTTTKTAPAQKKKTATQTKKQAR